MNRQYKQGKFKKTMGLFIWFLVLFSIGFLAGSHAGKKNSVVVSAVKNNEDIKNHSQKNNNIVEKTNESKVENNIPKSEEKLQPVLDPYKPDGKKIVYLTFDDGPSANVTPEILDILKTYNVKATFFLIGKMANQNSALVKRENKGGHSVCIHTYSHDYNQIYSSTESFLNDIRKCDNVIKSILGENYDNKLIRFPGGSFGNRMNPFKEAVKESEYRYIDWNALNGDAEANCVPADRLLSRLEETAAGQEHLVILMHDAPAKETTAQALPSIIEYLKSQGYEFRPLY